MDPDQRICQKCFKPAKRAVFEEFPELEYYECDCGNKFAIEQGEKKPVKE